MLLCSADHGCLDSLLPMQNKNLKMFPVPNAANQTSTIMGGLILSIPETSTHKDLA